MTDTDLEIPPALETAVHLQATYAKAFVADLGTVRTRARSLRRRSTALRGAAAATLILALAAGYLAIRARTGPDVVDGGSVGRVPIGLWLNRDKLPVTAGLPSGIHIAGSDGEVAAQLRSVNGRNEVVAVGLPAELGGGSYAGPAPLPGGGLATVGYTPPPSYTVAGQKRIVIVGSDGVVVSSRAYPHVDGGAERSMPMTGSATKLYWWSQVGSPKNHWILVAYDIASGTIRETTPKVPGNGWELPYFGMQATATRIINWPAFGGDTCSADIVDAATGERVTTLKPAIANCTDVYYALSPDNKHAAALVTYRSATAWSQRVVVVDVRTGQVQKTFTTPALATGSDRTKLVSGLDWTDDKTLRYARGSLAGGDPILLRMKL